MARCGCAGASCTCVIEGSGSVVVTGGGSEANPFTVEGPVLTVGDSSTVDLTISGAGTTASPWVLSAAALVSLDELTDVSTAGAATGEVLTRQSDGSWAPAPAATATPGLISHDGSLLGDGSAGSPLGVDLDTNSGLSVAAGGLRVDGVGLGGWSAYSPVLSSDGGTDPVLGTGTITGRYCRIGKLVAMKVAITISSNTQRGTGNWQVSLPVSAEPGQTQLLTAHMKVSGIGDWLGEAMIEDYDATHIKRIFFETASTNAAFGFRVGRPTDFPAGSQIFISGMYEAG